MRFIGLLLSIFLSLTCQAEIIERFALIKDNDGYVNLRERDNLQSKIIKSLPNNTIVSAYCEKELYNNDFCFIFTSKDQTGYVYKNRLLFFDKNSRFIKIPITSNNKTLTTNFLNISHNININIKIKPTTINASKIAPFDPLIKECPIKYKGFCSYGINSGSLSLDEKYYTFDNISIYLKNNKLIIPNNLLRNLYIPQYLVHSKQAFDRTQIYFNPSNNHIYIMSLQGDVTGVYSVVYKVVDKKNIKRYVWAEDI